jgi:hypothetical protein
MRIAFMALVASGLTLMLSTGPAQALVIEGESSAFGVSADVGIVDRNTLLGIGVNATVGPVPSVAGMAPPPYALSDQAATASASAGSLLILGQGLIQIDAGVAGQANALSVSASSDVDGLPGNLTAEAAAAVANFSSTASLVGLLSLLNTADLFSFRAQTLTSSAEVTGDFGALVASGDSVIVDATGNAGGFITFSALGVDFQVAVDAQGRVPPNTSLTIDASSHASFGNNLGTDLEGSIEILLNEQVVTGDGITELAILVNAMRITFIEAGASFFDVLGLNIDDTNLLSGEIIVSQSFARLEAIPEPATLVFGMLSAAILTAGRRRRRRCV